MFRVTGRLSNVFAGRMFFLGLLLLAHLLFFAPSAWCQQWQLTIEQESPPREKPRAAGEAAPEELKDLLSPVSDSGARIGQTASSYRLILLNNSQSDANILLDTETPGPDNILRPGEERKVSGQAPAGGKLKISAPERQAGT